MFLRFYCANYFHLLPQSYITSVQSNFDAVTGDNFATLELNIIADSFNSVGPVVFQLKIVI